MPRLINVSLKKRNVCCVARRNMLSGERAA
jgi:hypothetical protein